MEPNKVKDAKVTAMNAARDVSKKATTLFHTIAHDQPFQASDRLQEIKELLPVIKNCLIVLEQDKVNAAAAESGNR